MKKIAIRSLVISTLALVGGAAYAADETSDTSEGLSPKNTVTPYGIIQANENFIDTQRSNTPDFQASRVRPGVIVRHGIVSGQFEVQYSGNNAFPTTPAVPHEAGINNTVTLRQAQLNLDVFNFKYAGNTYLTTISLGGIRINGANATSPDVTYTESGFARQDGVHLQEAVTMGKMATAQLGLGVFNNLYAVKIQKVSAPFAGWSNQATTFQAPWGSTSFNTNPAWAFNLGGTVNLDAEKSVNAVFYYGAQHNSAITTPPAAVSNNSQGTSFADVNHLEVSGTYNDVAIFGNKGVISGNGVTVWYERDAFGRTHAGKYDGGGNYTYTSTTDDSAVGSVVGVSAAADSHRYLSNMLQNGDRLTYAASYTHLMADFGSSTYSNNYKVDTVALSAGYAVGTFETALNFSYDKSGDDIFLDSSGGGSTAVPDSVPNQNHATKLYLTAFYAF